MGADKLFVFNRRLSAFICGWIHFQCFSASCQQAITAVPDGLVLIYADIFRRSQNASQSVVADGHRGLGAGHGHCAGRQGSTILLDQG
jgi:hypothetical protein